MDEVTKAKIKILSSPSEWTPELFKHIDKDQVPVMYGGTLPNPPMDDVIVSMDPPEGSYIDSAEASKIIPPIEADVETS